MTKVIAAIDNSAAAGPVLATAGAVARMFDASLEAVHVRENGYAVASHQARRAGLPLTTLEGTTVAALVAATTGDVAAVVLGARGTPGGRPVGGTALEVISVLSKPVAVVPPGAAPPARIRRVLLPLQGTPETSMAPARALLLAPDAHVEIVVLHVVDESSLPRFTDQPQHETRAWATEFLARYCPVGLGSVRLELRIGRPEEEILDVAGEMNVDLVALGWNQELSPGRATIVRSLLERGTHPVLLVPALPRSLVTRRDEGARLSLTG